MSYRKKHINPKIKKLRKRKPLWQYKWIWILMLFIILVGTLFYLFFFLEKIQVNKIVVAGNENVLTDDIQLVAQNVLDKKMLSFLPTKNILLTDTAAIKNNIAVEFPEIATVEVQKKYFQTISITVAERQSMGHFCQAESQCFDIDNQGVIFRSAEAKANIMTVARPANDPLFSLGQEAVDKNIAQVIEKVQQDVKDHFQLDIKEVVVVNPLIFTMAEGWYLYIDPNSNIDNQIAKLNTLLDKEIAPEARKKLEYIYLQYKDRAYYK